MRLEEYRETIADPLPQTTLCFLLRDDEILLAMKKRGFGSDKWNGFGGKLQAGETLEQALMREAQEELGIVPIDAQIRAITNFYLPHDPSHCQQVIIYVANNWDGDPIESEEMRPQWFKKDQLPLEHMWPDDSYWLPEVLAGRKIKAAFMFAKDSSVEDYMMEKVEELSPSLRI